MPETVVARAGGLTYVSSREAPPQLEALPTYVSEPTVEPCKTDKFTRFIVLDTITSTLDYGSFIVGSVVVTPRRPVEPGKLVVEVVGDEQALVRKGQFWRSNQRASRKYVCNRIILPFSCTLEPNFKYRFAFSLQFPVGYDHIECKNGLNHCTIPPTLGVGTDVEISPYGALIDYHLRAFFSGELPTFCRRNLVFTPRKCLLFDLETFVDENNKSLDREYSSSARLTTKQFRGSLLALITMHGRAFRHDADEHSGTMQFTMDLIPTGDKLDLAAFQDFKASFVIRKVIYAAPKGIGNKLCKTPENAVQSFKVSSGTADVDFEWTENTAQVTAAYEIEQPILLRTPNFVSCYTAVTYEFEIILKHKHVSASLAVPMIIHYPQPLPYGNC